MRKTSRRLIDDDNSSSDENAGDTDVRDIAAPDAVPVVNDDHNAGLSEDPVDTSIASANSEDEMAVFDEEMEDEDFTEQMEFTGDLGPGTPVIPSSSGTPGVIFDRSASKKRTSSYNQAGDDTIPQNDPSDDDLASDDNGTEISQYEQLRLDNIAEREAAMKEAEAKGFF